MHTSPRHFTRTLFVCTLAAIFLAACSGDQAEMAAAADPSSVTQPAPTAASSEQDDETIIRNFRMSVDKARAVLAIQEAVHARVMADPALRARLDNFDESLDENSPDLTTVAGLVWMVEQFPETVTEVRRAGLSVQDYVLASQTLTSLMWYDMARQAGQTPEYIGLATERNVAVFDQNRDEFRAISARMQEMAQQADS